MTPRPWLSPGPAPWATPTERARRPWWHGLGGRVALVAALVLHDPSRTPGKDPSR